MSSSDAARVSRLVLCAPNWLGDAVLALPAMAALRAHFPDAHLAVAAVPGVAPMFREQSGVRPDAVIELASPNQATAALEGGGFELGVLFPNSFRSAWVLRRAGIPARWGYPTAMRGWLLTRRSTPGRTHGVQHHAEYFRRLVRGLGIDCGDAAPRLVASGRSLERAGALLGQHGLDGRGGTLIGFAPGAAYGGAKQWMPDRVADVAARLVREHDATCLLLGATHDRPVARAIESWLRAHAPDAAPRVLDFVGRTALGTLAGIAARCRVFVSNDSGAMHLAAALGRPVVAIFGSTDERATRPIGAHEVIAARAFCRPCLLRDCPIDHRCMKRISADEVFAAVSRQLASTRSDRTDA